MVDFKEKLVKVVQRNDYLVGDKMLKNSLTEDSTKPRIRRFDCVEPREGHDGS